jgi:ubiquinone/menaquinone biosynthesis C-methylase UbiE
VQARSNVEWQKWAQDDPLYGIATRCGRSRDGTRPWTLDEFYEYGALNWSEYYPHWCRYGVEQKSCLEIGCGAGRITRQLVRCFGSVYGVDISSEMLTLAKRNVAGATCLLSDGTTIPLPDDSVSAVFSCEVFQHFDNRSIALSYFREIHRVLSPQGTCMIQLPIVILPLHRIFPAMGTIQRFLWHVGENWVRAKANMKRWLISYRNRRPFIYLIQYEPQWLMQNLSTMGFSDIEIQLFAITGNPGERYLDSFLLARKSTAMTDA